MHLNPAAPQGKWYGFSLAVAGWIGFDGHVFVDKKGSIIFASGAGNGFGFLAGISRIKISPHR